MLLFARSSNNERERDSWGREWARRYNSHCITHTHRHLFICAARECVFVFMRLQIEFLFRPQVCVVFSFLGVSIVLYIVSRFSPHEWRPMTVMTPNNNFTIQTQTITTHQTTSVNEFTLLNSFWFAIAALMQQGCDFTPRSLPGECLMAAAAADATRC
jgi:hypothetical protein